MPEPGPAEWLAYYSRKRIMHQWTQLYLLGATDCCTVLEIGPALGLVTSLLVNIGYDVTTLDRGPRSFAYPDVPHLERDLCALRVDPPQAVKGFPAAFSARNSAKALLATIIDSRMIGTPT